jgi:hypothetical protein
MKSTIVQPMSNLRRYFMRAIGAIVLTVACWQGLSIGVDAASADSMVASSQPSIVKQVVERQENAAMKDRQNPATSLLNTTETGVQIDADKAEKPMGDTPAIVKETADRNVKQAEKFSEKTTKKVKNFFGF